MTDPLLTTTQRQNLDQLRLLGIFFMIKAFLELGIALLWTLIVVGASLIFSTMAQHANDPGPLLGLLLLTPLVIGLIILVPLGLLDFIAARSLSRTRRRTLCWAAALISLLSFPLGTLLGIFALIILSKPSVKEMFDR